MGEVQTERPAKECGAVFALYSEEHREDGRLRHGAAGSVSELKALGNQGDDPYCFPLRRYQPSFPSLTGERERKAHDAWSFHPPGTIKTLEPGVRRSATTATPHGLLPSETNALHGRLACSGRRCIVVLLLFVSAEIVQIGGRLWW